MARKKKSKQPPPSTSEEPRPRRASVEELERGLALLHRGSDAAAGGGSETSSTAGRRRTLQADAGTQPPTPRPKANAAVVQRGVRPTQPPMPPPPPSQQQQQQQHGAAGEGGLHRDKTGAWQVRPEQFPQGRRDPALIALAGGPVDHDGQAPVVAVPKGTAKHPSQKKKKDNTKQAGSGEGESWLSWLRSLIFSREEFTDFAPGRAGVRSPTTAVEGASGSRLTGRGGGAADVSVKDWQRRVAAWLENVRWLPAWGKRAVFDTVDFFTRARVYLAVAVVVLAVMYAAAPSTVDALSAVSGTFTVDEKTRPGKTFLDKYNHGSRALPRKHPVAIMPGFITGALELWEARGTCLERQSTSFSTFRQHMFGAQMVFLLLTDPACWLELFGVDKQTGKDKPGIKVRADSGFTSVEYFVAGYWVWAKVLINLADIGYDPQSMAVLTYDWRLSPALAHERDGFFYSARNSIKFLCQKNRERAVVISHSYGTTVALAFFKWEEQREPGFMNKYVAYYVNVGGTTMGIPKAASALLMGDVKDTVMIPSTARRIFDTFMAQSLRYNVTRTWSCLYAMSPHGCNAVLPEVFTFADGSTADMGTVMDMITAECIRSQHTHCVEEMEQFRREAHELPVLPQAPDTTVVCLYGVNKSSEVGYVLEDVGRRSQQSHNKVTGESLGTPDPARADSKTSTVRATPPVEECCEEDCECDDDDDGDEALEASDDVKIKRRAVLTEEEVEGAYASADVAKWVTNTSSTDENTVQGVRLGNGDGTVPLGSLAYMCRAPNGWARNVGRVETVEFLNDVVHANPLNLRGDSISGDHVDILGNYELIETILKIVSGVDEVGAEPGQDAVEWEEEEEEESAANSAKNGKATTKKGKGKKHTVTLHRRVNTRLLSNVDSLIETEWAACLEKPNNPITPRPARDDNEFL